MPKRGKLIAIEGGGSPAMELASKQLLRVLKKTDRNTGVSAWDASGVFYDLLQGDRMLPGASPQVLMMLYASDLAFRLRWQIEPALESGQTVVANCYVETAMSFGRATGLSRPWLANLFDFCPRPGKVYRAPEESLAFNRRTRSQREGMRLPAAPMNAKLQTSNFKRQTQTPRTIPTSKNDRTH